MQTDRRSPLKLYIEKGNLLVDGWLEPGAIEIIVALDQCQKDMQIRGHVAEIGVHHGRLFILLCLLAQKEEHALAIDLFSMQDRNTDQSGCGDMTRFLANLDRWAKRERVLIEEGDSSLMTADHVLGLLPGPIRIFSVDGGHTPELTKHDLETASQSIVDGGIVIVDDYFNEMWPGVCEGVGHFFETPRDVVPFAIGGNKVFLTTNRFAAPYQTRLKSLGLGFRRHDRMMLSHPVVMVEFYKQPLSMREKIGRTAFWRTFRDQRIGRAIRSFVGKRTVS